MIDPVNHVHPVHSKRTSQRERPYQSKFDLQLHLCPSVVHLRVSVPLWFIGFCLDGICPTGAGRLRP